MCAITRPILDTGPLVGPAARRAHELRDEAIDQFWQGAAHAASRGLRSAQRLARSLARHRRLRGVEG